MKFVAFAYLFFASLHMNACGQAPKAPNDIASQKPSSTDQGNDSSADSQLGGKGKTSKQGPWNGEESEENQSSGPSKPSVDEGAGKPDSVASDPIKPDPILPKDPTAPSASCSSFDFTKMTKIEDILCLGSREKVFQALPDLLRASFTLMEKSRSAQEASLEEPRVIVVSQDGSLLLGAATAKTGAQDLEVAFYDYEKNTFDFAGIDFSVSPPKVERELCKTCHGAEPRPIWAAYSQWEGSFEPTNKGLTAPQADVLNRLAKGDTQSPILKALKYRPSYAANRLFSAASGMGETETNEMIGIMMAVKRSQMLSAKLLNDAKISKQNLSQILNDSLCANSTNTLESLGYPVKEHMMTGIVGVDEKSYRFRNPNIGFQNLNTYFGHILLKALMDKDPSLKASIPSADKLYYSNVNWNSLTGKGLGAFLSQAKSTRRGYVSFRDHLNGELRRATGNGSEICNALKSYK